MSQARQQFSCERGQDRKDTTEIMVEVGFAGCKGASVMDNRALKLMSC